MVWKTTHVWLALSLPLLAAAEDVLVNSGGVSVHILGQSGKMILSSDEFDSALTVGMDSLFELDAQGNEVGNTGPPSGKHSIQTFAAQNFAIDAEPTRTAVDGIETDQINFTTSLVDGVADFKVLQTAQLCLERASRIIQRAMRTPSAQGSSSVPLRLLRCAR
jgi:hypothetical protein